MAWHPVYVHWYFSPWTHFTSYSFRWYGLLAWYAHFSHLYHLPLCMMRCFVKLNFWENSLKHRVHLCTPPDYVGCFAGADGFLVLVLVCGFFACFGEEVCRLLLPSHGLCHDGTLRSSGSDCLFCPVCPLLVGGWWFSQHIIRSRGRLLSSEFSASFHSLLKTLPGFIRDLGVFSIPMVQSTHLCISSHSFCDNSSRMMKSGPCMPFIMAAVSTHNGKCLLACVGGCASLLVVSTLSGVFHSASQSRELAERRCCLGFLHRIWQVYQHIWNQSPGDMDRIWLLSTHCILSSHKGPRHVVNHA